MHDLPFIQYNAKKVSPSSARYVQGQQGQFKVSKVSQSLAR